MLICCGLILRVGYNRWPKRILTWSPKGKKKKRKNRFEVEKGSGKSDEAVEDRSKA